ncbi:MAG: ABC transporter substrate-binding protein [Alphaproteobacteria bacterium]
MNKYLLGLIVVLSLTACDGKKDNIESNKPVVKIGVITSLTGNYAEMGNNVKAAIEIAKDDIGDGPIDFKLIFEDYGYESKKAAVVASKLINVNKIDSLISWSSAATNVTAPIAQLAEIVNFGITNELKAAEGKYNFTHWTPSESLVNKLMEEIKSIGNIKSMGMFVSYQSSMQQTANLLENKLKEQGIEVVRENFDINNKDFVLTVEKMKNKNLDAWYIGALSPSVDLFLKSFFLQNVEKPLFAIDSYVSIKDLSSLNGFRFVTVPDGSVSLLRELKERTGSSNYFSIAYAYDVAKLLMLSYNDFYKNNNRLPTSDELVEMLLNVKNYEGAVGRLSVNSDGVVISEAIVKEIKNGKLFVVEE